MNAIHTPVQPNGSESQAAKRAHPRDEAIARVVDRCRISAGETPEMQPEMRYLTHAKQGLALETIRQVGADFRAHFGRRSGGVLTTHRLYASELAVLGLGSAFEAITAAVDELRGPGMSVGALGLRCFRPFPTQDVGAALLHCERVVIVERALAVESEESSRPTSGPRWPACPFGRTPRSPPSAARLSRRRACNARCTGRYAETTSNSRSSTSTASS